VAYSVNQGYFGGAWKLLSELREVYEVVRGGDVLKSLQALRLA